MYSQNHIGKVIRGSISGLVFFGILLAWIGGICWGGTTQGKGAPPHRIVSLAPNLTEILFAVGLDREIVGVTQYCNFPEEARKKPRVGGVVNPGLESIVRLRPDAVFAVRGFNPPETLAGVRRLGIPVYEFQFFELQDVFHAILKIGGITGHPSDARLVVSRMQSKLDALSAAPVPARKPRVLYVISEQPSLSAGPGSFIHDVIQRAGGENVMGDALTSYPFFNLEEVVRRNPEVILFSSEIGEPREAFLARWGRWHQIAAVSSKRVYEVNSDLINRPGPRIVDGIETLSRILNHESSQP
ncbi:MAG: cobalamin-binding protein [Nitrospirae bacterium]|nr:cobalamin-binding protein [Nitrospirota bacterium]